MRCVRSWALAMPLLLASALGGAAQAAQTNTVVGVKQNMSAYLFTPDGNAPSYPGILLLHTSGGLRDADLAYAQQLMNANYVVLVPAFMAAYNITARTRQATFTTYADQVYADLVSALGTLQQNPKVAGHKLGAVGFSNGGYFAMWLAATAKVSAGVAYYGAFTGAATDRGLGRFRSAFSRDSAPVLILHGMSDDTVPVQFAQGLAGIVKAAGSPFEIQLYAGAGHEFDRVPGSDNRAATEDAWPRTLAFFKQYLQ